MILYKYLSPENAIRVISSRALRFTQPSQLNDVFDLRPNYENFNEATVLKTELTTDKIKEQTEEFFNNMFSGLPSEFQGILKAHANLDSAASQAHQFIKGIFDGFSQIVRKQMFENLDKLAGVLCLSELADSNLMWGRYGSEHRGVVLGFDTENEYFNRKRTDDDELRQLVKVDYLPERARVQLLEDEDAGHKILYSKTDAWAYECEWRMLQALRDADEIVEGQPSIHLFRFDPRCLTHVIYGCRTSDKIKQDVRGLVDSSFEHVKLLQIRPDDTTDKLDIVDAEDASIDKAKRP